MPPNFQKNLNGICLKISIINKIVAAPSPSRIFSAKWWIMDNPATFSTNATRHYG